MQELARQLASLAQEQRQHRQQQRGNAAAGSAAAAAAAAAVTGGPDTQSGAVMHAPSGYEDQGKIHAGGSAGAPSKGPSQGDPRFVAVQDIHEPSWGNSPPARQHLPLQQQQAQLQQQQGTWPTLHSHLTPLPPQPVRPWQDHTWSRHAAAHQQPRGTLQDSPQQQHQYQLVYQQQQHQQHQHLLQQQVSPSSGPLQGAIPMAVHGQAASEQQVLLRQLLSSKCWKGAKKKKGCPWSYLPRSQPLTCAMLCCWACMEMLLSWGPRATRLHMPVRALTCMRRPHLRQVGMGSGIVWYLVCKAFGIRWEVKE